MKKSIVALLCLTFLVGAFIGCTKNNGKTEDGKSLDERSRTLYVTGMAWGAPTNFNWFTGYPTWPVNIQSNPLVYEMLFMFNSQTGALEPLLATEYSWLDDYTVEVKLNKNAKFSDGESVTAEDVYYSLDVAKRYDMAWSSVWEHLQEVVIKDEYTIHLKLKPDDHNVLGIQEVLALVPIHPEHIWASIEEDVAYDFGSLTEIFNEKPIASGPYQIKFYDETKIVIERREDYWGEDVFGGLPAPEFITHLLFSSNDTATNALKEGHLDYSENFIPNVDKLWEEGLPIRTYLKEKPYYVSDTMPMIYLNLHKPGLNDPEVRRALAYAIDYGEIIDKAVSGYSPDMKPAITIEVNQEQNLVSQNAIKDLQWTYDPEKAKEILDSIGAKPGADGIRVLPDGTRLGPWKLECPYGWSDWNAALEVVMQSAKEVGIELQTEFPEWAIWDNHKRTGEFDIIMDTPAAYITPANPWKRAADVMSSISTPPMGETAFSNYGRYHNDRANEILKRIPTLTDEKELQQLYTELNQIYLLDIPTIPLMYRPTYFYTVSEAVWENFVTEETALDIPPYLFDGAGIKGLYVIDHKSH